MLYSLTVPNKNYLAGRTYEYKLKHVLEEQGWKVIRASGSHGPWDLIAVKDQSPVRCIQVKRVKTHTALRAEFAKFTVEWTLLDYINGKTSYVTELWVWLDREGWHVKD